MELILASASPARYQLLQQLGISCRRIPTYADESCNEPDPILLAKELAQRKLSACLDAHPHEAQHIIIAADTVVAIGNRIIGKAETRDQASSYLNLLSGNNHQVITGFVLHLPGRQAYCDHAVTTVSFHPLTSGELSTYLDSDEWQHAAGAYRIQGSGGLFVKQIVGSFWNIVGLPIEQIFGMIRSQEYIHVVKST